MTCDSEVCGLLADFACSLSNSQVAPHVLKRAKWSVLDYVSSLLAGLKHGEMSSIIRRYVEQMGGIEECSVAGTPVRFPAAWAALANGVISHTVELDDGHRFGMCHPGVAVIPAALAQAERGGNTGAEFLLSVIVGYDVMLRVAAAMNPGHWRRGFHSTGTCGALGSSAAVAKLMGHDSEKTMYAISMGALQGAGLQQMLHSNPMIKPLQPGKAALAGVMAGELAGLGARSPSSVFEGELGFFVAMTDTVHGDLLTEELGARFEIERTYFKFYPTCRLVHCSLDLLREMIGKHPIAPEMVEAIEVRTSSVAVKEVAQITHPDSQDAAMFSIPYALAVWLCEGRFAHAELHEPFLSRKDIRRIAARVSVTADAKWDAAYPEKTGAELTIKLSDGRTLSESADRPFGEPENMDTDGPLIEKYYRCSKGVLAERDVEPLLEVIRNLEQEENVLRLTGFLRTAQAPATNAKD